MATPAPLLLDGKATVKSMVKREEKTILLETRKELGLTQTQVADKAHITLRQYQKFENGERKLTSSSFHTASKVLQALEIDITTFACGGYGNIDTI